MNLDEAWRTLGLAPTEDTTLLRRRFAQRLHDLHPDRSIRPDAHDRTVALTIAYRTILAHLALRPSPPPAPELVPIAVTDDDRITVGLRPDETFGILLEAAQRLGEITHIDPGSGLLQTTVEFVEAPPCQLTVLLEETTGSGVGLGVDLVSLTGDPPPPLRAVVGLLVAEMVRVSPASRTSPPR